MRRRAVARGKDLPRNDERRHIGPEIAEEVRQAIKRNERISIAPMVGVRDRARIDASYQKHSQ